MTTTYMLNLVAGNIFQTKTSPAIPTKYYIGFSSTAPALDGTGVTEPSGGNYARVLLDSLSEPADGVITNKELVEFAESDAEWGVMTYYVIYDALTGGNLLMYQKLKSSRTVEDNTIMLFKAGELELSVVNVDTSA